MIKTSNFLSSDEHSPNMPINPMPARSAQLSVLLAPLAAPLLFFIGLLFAGGFGFHGLAEALKLMFVVFAIGAPVSYGATILFGYPLYRFLLANNWFSTGALVVGGIVIGAPVNMALFHFVIGGQGHFFAEGGQLLWSSIVGAAMGGIVALMFSLLLYGPKRPLPPSADNW
ncbi:hypothetical protein [Thiosocius teredinicola]|uniref:hypothetical protein n=1 Tax=Thiosocius teredinicola TaxID=1973002 RepID=UPI000F771C67